jgi:hypothetical protein
MLYEPEAIGLMAYAPVGERRDFLIKITFLLVYLKIILKFIYFN